MAGFNEDPDRNVVPRWRRLDSPIASKEHASLKVAEPNRFTDEMLVSIKKEWEESPDLYTASDFISVAFTFGRFELASAAAHSVLNDSLASTSAKDLAELYLAKGLGRSTPTNGAQETSNEPLKGVVAIEHRLRAGVRNARTRLAAYPRNPVLWNTLALLHTALGQADKADRAIRVAMEMAPADRLILRSAARFYLHQGQHDRAHRLLEKSPGVRADPWLLASEIAIASAIGRTSKHIRVGRSMIERGTLLQCHTSELASALGTLEVNNGDIRSARRLIDLSLESAAENAIAQAAFLFRKVGQVGREAGHTLSHEANAWFASRSANWALALKHALEWQADQPFSCRPARLGAYLAGSLLDDDAEAAAIARLGLLGSPNDFNLQNSLALYLARDGKVDDAIKVYREVDILNLDPRQRIVCLATWGLICFRYGDYDGGRALYQRAIGLGAAMKDDQREAVARVYYAFEELRIGSPKAEEIRKQAIEGAKVLTGPDLKHLVQSLENYRTPLRIQTHPSVSTKILYRPSDSKMLP